MESLALSDVEQIVQLVAQAGDPTVDLSLAERKRQLMRSLATLIDADVWLWSASVPNPDVPGDVATATLIDGGYEDGRQQKLVYEALSDPGFGAAVVLPIVQAAAERRYVTFVRQDLADEKKWAEVGAIWRNTGLEHILLTVYPISDDTYSAIGFHRRQGKPNFTERERSIVHVIFRQVDWLHRHGTNVPAKDHVIHLSPRERQVLVLLLAGLAKKEIAARLEISEHTVGDYIKQLHKHFDVNSRAELQAVFHTGATIEKGAGPATSADAHNG